MQVNYGGVEGITLNFMSVFTLNEWVIAGHHSLLRMGMHSMYRV
jgi:hypothetical protein